jgi:hypothetical protein
MAFDLVRAFLLGAVEKKLTAMGKWSGHARRFTFECDLRVFSLRARRLRGLIGKLGI